MFLLPWFDLQQDYIGYYTVPYQIRMINYEMAKQESSYNEDPHKSHKPQAPKRDLPEPAYRERRFGAVTLPDYTYFIYELFPHFGLTIHANRLPNGTQHQFYASPTAVGVKLGGVESIEREKILKKYSTKMAEQINEDPKDPDVVQRCKKALVEATLSKGRR